MEGSKDDAIYEVMEAWPLEWHTLDLATMEKIVEQQQKKDAKLRIAWVAKKRCQEQEMATQLKATEAATTAQTVEPTTTSIRELEEG